VHLNLAWELAVSVPALAWVRVQVRAWEAFSQVQRLERVEQVEQVSERV